MRQCKNCTSTISSKNNPKGKGILYYHVEQGLSINYWCWNVKSKVTGCNNPEPKKRAGVTNNEYYLNLSEIKVLKFQKYNTIDRISLKSFWNENKGFLLDCFGGFMG